MEFLKMLEAKEKARAVILSCKTISHLETSKQYVELYNDKFEDFLGYQELQYEIESHEQTL